MDIFLSLVSGQAFADGVSLSKKQVNQYARHIELIKNLDDYYERFNREKQLEIDLSETRMETIAKKRDTLIDLAKNHIENGYISVKSNSKEEFISFACRELGNNSPVVRNYLSGFYDLVFYNMTKDMPDDYKAIKTYLTDLVSDFNNKNTDKYNELKGMLNRLISRIDELENEKKRPVDFDSYYQIVKDKFASEKRDVYKSLVGSMSDEESYIDTYIKVGTEEVSVLSFLDNWFCTSDSEAILIYGEPGHGKSLLCEKAVTDFYKGRFLKEKANAVLAVSLNTGQNRKIVSEGEIDLEKALTWRDKRKHEFSFEDCRGALLFMDGFDEFIEEAKRAKTEILNIYDFMQYINEIAEHNGIHIVILSRAMAVKNYLDSLSGIYHYYRLLPISEDQQNNWLNEHKEYSSYKEALKELQHNDDMRELLGVPLLFRLIVHNRFKTASANIVELYDKLLITLLKKRHIIDNKEILSINNSLMDLAYRIYCTNTETTILYKNELDERLLSTFYVCVYNERKIGFFHRTFYQYFLTKYIYSQIIALTDEKAKEVVGKWAEREFDETVRQYLALMFKEKKGEDETKIYANLGKMIETLSMTEAYINMKPRFESGDFDKSRIHRSQNIYRNIFFIAEAVSYMVRIPYKDNLDILARKFSSNEITLISKEGKRVDLSGACLAGAYFKQTKLNGADLTKVDLRGADLREARLCNSLLHEARLMEANLSRSHMDDAILNGANLRGANLKSASLKNTDLTNADMRGTDLTAADLTYAHLIGVRMRGGVLRDANLYGTDLRGASLRGVDLRGASITGAKFDGAYLRGADMTGANFIDVNLNNAELYEAKIDSRYKDMIDPSAKGYNTITWVSYERFENTGEIHV